jgi:subtilisin family serine protease
MKRTLLFALLVAGAALASPKVTPQLAAHLEEVPAAELVRVIVVMEEQVPLEKLTALTDGLSRDERRVVVEHECSRVADSSQREVVAYLNERAAAGRAADVTPLWIVNAVAARADRETIERVSTLPGVDFVDWDREAPVEALEDIVDGQRDEIVWGVDKINAPKVWNEGYKGAGIVVCVCDGGVNYNHVDLKDHMWNKSGYPNHGRNFAGGDPNDTMDYDGHGTHVAGTVASDGTAGSQCGVAPEATIMIARLGGWESTWFQAWQWAITEGADVITQSWSYKYPYGPLYAQHRQASEKTLAAGVIHTNSTGNEGHLTNQGYDIPFNIPAPANCPPPWLHPDQKLREGKAGTIGVGSTQTEDWRVATSGRGPASWDKSRHGNIAPYDDYHWDPGMGLLKPDVMAPGSNIKSCDYANVNGYKSMSGTSMATPHVAGAAALLLDYLDTLPPAQIEKALELSAAKVFGGTHQKGRKVNDYGAGRVDVYAALDLLKKSIGVDLKYFRAAGLDDRVRLAWDCESGAYAGFNLYREAENGAADAGAGRARLNAELITGRTPFAFEDRDVAAGATYKYWLEVIPTTGKAELFGPASATPGLKKAYGFALEPAYPNPAGAGTTIAFSLPVGVSGDYAVTIYDLAGRKVRTLAAAASAPGRREVVWDLADDAGRRVAPGVYLYWLNASCGSAARRLVVAR